MVLVTEKSVPGEITKLRKVPGAKFRTKPEKTSSDNFLFDFHFHDELSDCLMSSFLPWRQYWRLCDNICSNVGSGSDTLTVFLLSKEIVAFTKQTECIDWTLAHESDNLKDAYYLADQKS